MPKSHDALYKAVTKLPENKLTQPIIDKMGEKLTKDLREAEQEALKKNWELTMLHQKLKQLIADPSISDEQRAKFQESERRTAALLEDFQARFQKMRENQQDE